MNRPNRSSRPVGPFISLAIAATAVAGVVLISRTAATDRQQPREQVQPNEQPSLLSPKVDPLFDAAPHDGQLVQQRCAPAGCDTHAVAEYLAKWGGYIYVTRVYRTPASYNLDQLRQRFDPPAAAGGWRLHLTDSYSHPPARNALARVIYCRQTGEDIWYAGVLSSNFQKDHADPQAQPVVGVQVDMRIGPPGSTCGIENRGTVPDTIDDIPAAATDRKERVTHHAG